MANDATPKQKYVGKDNYGKPKSEYLARLAAMTDAELYKESTSKIWLSAYANNNPRSDFHWHADAIYDEWESRGKLAEYNRAFEQVRSGL